MIICQPAWLPRRLHTLRERPRPFSSSTNAKREPGASILCNATSFSDSVGACIQNRAEKSPKRDLHQQSQSSCLIVTVYLRCLLRYNQKFDFFQLQISFFVSCFCLDKRLNLKTFCTFYFVWAYRLYEPGVGPMGVRSFLFSFM